MLLPEIEPVRFNIEPQNDLEAIAMAIPQQARGAFEYAQQFKGSYRGCDVGSATLTKSADGRYYIVYASNYKAGPESGKVCSERLGVYRATDKPVNNRKRNLDVLSTLVDADHFPDTHSGREFPTTHPCGLCRTGEHTFHHPLVDPDVVLLTRLRHRSIIQAFSLVELETIHTDDAAAAELGQTVIADPLFVRLRRRILPQLQLIEMGVTSSEVPVEEMSRAEKLRQAWAA